MRIQAIKVLAEINPDVARARELYDKLRSGTTSKIVASRSYKQLLLSTPMWAYVDGGSVKKLIVVPHVYSDVETIWLGEPYAAAGNIGRPDDIWDWETGQRLYINTKKTKRPWFNSIFTDPAGEARQKERETLKQHLLVIADYAEEVGNGVAAKALRWFAADPTRFSKVDKIIGK